MLVRPARQSRTAKIPLQLQRDRTSLVAGGRGEEIGPQKSLQGSHCPVNLEGRHQGRGGELPPRQSSQLDLPPHRPLAHGVRRPYPYNARQRH